MSDPRFLKRDTARALIAHEGRLLLIERIRPGKHYYSTPGGAIEENETPEQAVIREVHEETNLHVVIKREVYIWTTGRSRHHFFLCSYQGGMAELRQDSEEASGGPSNVHIPRWLSLAEVSNCSFGYWEPLKQRIVEDAQSEFPLKVVHLTA